MKRNRLAAAAILNLMLVGLTSLAHAAQSENESRSALPNDETRPALVAVPHGSAVTATHPNPTLKLHEQQSGSSASHSRKSGKLAQHRTRAVVIAVDKRGGTVTLSHAPVKSLKWPAMTMKFLIADDSLYAKFEVGKTVDVHFKKLESTFVVTAVE